MAVAMGKAEVTQCPLEQTALKLSTVPCGQVHSVETMGTLDGPGLRFVIFLQGCPLHCAYCHNRDTWSRSGGQLMTVDQVWAQLLRYRPYMEASGGGVTVSGGEPLLQAPFVASLFHRCHQAGIHTALDTSGFASLRQQAVTDLLAQTDLVLLSLKAMDRALHLRLTGVPPEPTRRFAAYLAEHAIPAWIRVVIIPGITDTPANLEPLAAYVSSLPNVTRVELLPFTKLGEPKWTALGDRSPLADVRAAGDQDVARAATFLVEHGLPARLLSPDCLPDR